MTLDAKRAAAVLRRIAGLMEVHDENPFRIRALVNAARAVEGTGSDLAGMVADGTVTSLKGIGKGTAEVLGQLAAGQHPEALVAIEAKTPGGVLEMLEVSGLGPKKVRTIWRDLGATGLGELEYSCKENRLVELPGFGRRSQERLLESLRFLRGVRDRMRIDEAHEAARELVAALGAEEGVVRAEIAGEVRRFSETVGAVDVVAESVDPDALKRAAGRCLSGLDVGEDRIFTGLLSGSCPCRITGAAEGAMGGALLWATGSEEHLRDLAERARNMGLRLDRDGVRESDRVIAGASEAAIYEALGCQWVPPELREGVGEVDQAAAGSLPDLVEERDLRGALHNHTVDSDGAASIEEMAAEAAALGWSFFGVADHSPAAHYANGVSDERIRDQWRRIDRWNESHPGLRVVKGLEADILADGRLDVEPAWEAGLEYVVASVHSSFRQSRDDQTARIVRAVRHRACRVLGHPTGRLLLARPGYEVDLEVVLQACAEAGVAVEINASPHRLDLDWRWAKRALELGLNLVVNPDAHAVDGLQDVAWGLAMARKAGATAADLVNTMDIGEWLRE